MEPMRRHDGVDKYTVEGRALELIIKGFYNLLPPACLIVNKSENGLDLLKYVRFHNLWKSQVRTARDFNMYFTESACGTTSKDTNLVVARQRSEALISLIRGGKANGDTRKRFNASELGCLKQKRVPVNQVNKRKRD